MLMMMGMGAQLSSKKGIWGPHGIELTFRTQQHQETCVQADHVPGGGHQGTRHTISLSSALEHQMS